jgi:hypothetical protein
MRDVLASAISSRAEEMSDFLRWLIAVPTENPPGREYATCVEVIARELEICPGLLEIRLYAERGMPALAYGPGLLSVPTGRRSSWSCGTSSTAPPPMH